MSFKPQSKDADLTVKPADPVNPRQFTPSREMPRVAALTPKPALNPALLPVKAQNPAQSGLSSYLASQGDHGRTNDTLFHPIPPTSYQFPRADNSQNIAAVPPRFLSSVSYQVFSKPRAGTPGYNPGGVNTTATP